MVTNYNIRYTNLASVSEHINAWSLLYAVLDNIDNA